MPSSTTFYPCTSLYSKSCCCHLRRISQTGKHVPTDLAITARSPPCPRYHNLVVHACCMVFPSISFIFSGVFKTTVAVSFSRRRKLIIRTIPRPPCCTQQAPIFLNTVNIQSTSFFSLMLIIQCLMAPPPPTYLTHFISTHRLVLFSPFIVPKCFAFFG